MSGTSSGVSFHIVPYFRSRLAVPRGAALLTTVLLAVIGATIALVALWTALAATRAAAAERDLSSAQSALLSVLGEYEARLIDDPYFFLSNVDRYERARICVGLDPARVVEPANPWPSGCGSYWTYTTPVGDPSGAAVRSQPVRIAVTAPSTDDPYLTVRAVATSGNVTIARERTYTLDSVAGITLYAEEDLRLEEVLRPGESAEPTELAITGDLYTASKLFLPTYSDVSLDDALLMAEEGFYPSTALTPSETLRLFCHTTPGSGGAPEDCPLPTQGLEDIRNVHPTPLRMSALNDDISRLADIACGPVNPADLPVPDGRSHHLCLRPGTWLTTAKGVARQVPEWASTYLIVPSVATAADGASTQLLTVYATEFGPSSVQDCLIRCSLPALARPEVDAGAHMGAITFWNERDLDASGSIDPGERGQLLGTFYAPLSGVVYVDGPVSVGLCGAAFLDPAAACYAFDEYADANEPGPYKIGVSASLTILAGTRSNPADIYISGPLPANRVDGDITAATGRLGLIATRHIFIPYWARTPGPSGDLAIDASLLALGIGADYDQGRFRGAISSLPSRIHSGYGVDSDSYYAEDNQGGSLTITGSIGGAAVDISTNQFRHIAVQRDPRLLSEAPPYFPSFNSRWNIRSVAEISPTTLCSDLACSAWNLPLEDAE